MYLRQSELQILIGPIIQMGNRTSDDQWITNHIKKYHSLMGYDIDRQHQMLMLKWSKYKCACTHVYREKNKNQNRKRSTWYCSNRRWSGSSGSAMCSNCIDKTQDIQHSQNKNSQGINIFIDPRNTCVRICMWLHFILKRKNKKKKTYRGLNILF